MAAPKGNKFWRARSSHGRKPIFATPEELWAACCEYFEWVEKNPLMSAEVVKYQGGAKLVDVPKMRAMTLAGLCLFLDISDDCWDDYRKRQDFVAVTTRAEKVIYAQKFAGAAADLLNPNIIARDLGLKDKTETEHKGGITVTITPDDAGVL